jgi:hypothetical protein
MGSKDDLFDTCPVCGGPSPCTGCQKNHERPGVERTDHTLVAVLPVDEDGLARVEAMLVERGYDPADWEVTSLTVNEWEAQRPKDRGIRVLRQTKASLRRVVPIEDTPWGIFLASVTSALNTTTRPTRRVLKAVDGPQTIVLMGDDQAPWVNWPLHEATCEALADLQPDRIIYMGDGFDFDQMSRFDVEHPEWQSTVNDTLRIGHRVLAERLDAAGNPPADYIDGNHEHRLQKYLLSKAQPLFGVKAAHLPEDAPSVLSVRFLAGLEHLGFAIAESDHGAYPHPNVSVADGYIATHGWVARKGAGASALASVERLASSIAVGHTHRLAVAHVTRWNADGEPIIYTTTETGTMADLSGLGYAKHPDWQGGWATVTVWPDGHHSTDVARWEGDTLRWRDRRWTITKTGIRRG